jgi:hypothetical protein
MDRKRRLAPLIVGERGWRPRAVASVLVVPDETWARNAVADFGALFDTALPARTVAVKRWLKCPSGDLRGMWFLLNSDTIGVRRRRGGPFRVRKRVRARREALDEASLEASRPSAARFGGSPVPECT